MSTQDHLDIADIRDDLVVLKNGKVVCVIETSSINFDLLDPMEKDAKIGSFAAFLNAIRFPIQIVIKTQKTDVSRYMQLLENYKLRITSQDVINQVNSYMDFINNLTQTTQILDKRFFAVVPSQNMPVIETSWIRQFFGQEKKIVNIAEIVKKAKEELHPKRDLVIQNFANVGIVARQLTSDELIKLYYSIYEPDKIGFELMTLKLDDVKSGISGNLKV
ncbi:hypothetical protein D6810_01395 [Candidatus Dojkabacteria bacterium]|uniref:TraC-like domain-containing protein n=1 Tax=Candidatus Dojkabacteria bacterium TaxID=2099670 RepID=A0A3M0Z561_9BACT|nr:MAG: hypothetical protein D6810_01395 [Candidatus Dojkabacteria bacterium]